MCFSKGNVFALDNGQDEMKKKCLTVIFKENGIDDPISDPVWNCMRFISHKCYWKRHLSIISPSKNL